jgi:hypothetical protein
MRLWIARARTHLVDLLNSRSRISLGKSYTNVRKILDTRELNRDGSPVMTRYLYTLAYVGR